MPDVYIDTDNSGGGRDGTSGNPYNTWNEAWEAEDTNIDPGETWNFFFKGATADNTKITVDGWPTAGAGDVTLNFYPWHTDFGAVSDGDDGWYQGDANWSSSHYRMDRSSGSNNDINISLQGDDETSDARVINIEGLQFGVASTGNALRCFQVDDSASGNINFTGNRWRHLGTGTFPRPFRSDSGITSAVKLTFTNNLFTYNGTQACSFININDGSTDADIINNTAICDGAGGGEDFFDDVAGCVIKAYNNAMRADAAGNIEFDSAGTLTNDYNASQTSGDRGANGFDCAEADFTTFGSGDADVLTPATSQTNAWGAGGVTQDDQALIPATDIRGNARNTGTGENTAIGCFAAAGEGDSSEHTLLADDAESASEVTSPSIGQEHVLLAADAESASEVTTPAVGQVHALLADDTESASETSSPAVGQTHALLADDAESASEVTAPAVGQTHVLLADDAESASETSSPVLGQEHVLLADDVESASEVSAPTVGTDGTHALLADDVESASEVTSPAIGQVHALLADDVESASETSAPTASESNVLLAEDVESASEVSAPAVGQAHVLLADDAESASETSAPTIAQVHVLFADDAESASEVTSPAIGEPITDTAPTAARRVILVSEPRLVTVAAESRIVILAAAADRAVMLAA